MERYDVAIIGAATTGSFFARRIAEKGFRVLVIDKLPEDKVGAKYDIFHVAKNEFSRFGLPLPEAGVDFAFEFTGGSALSAFGRYPKETSGTTVGMHMHEYTLRMNRWAMEAGAEYRYGAEFIDFIYEEGRITGIRYRYNGAEETASARIVADCSGIPSVARRKLPDSYGVENFEIGPADMFYVTLRYVRYFNETDFVKKIRTWTFYKTWEAPEADPTGAILGVGANTSFECGEQVFKEFERAIPLPKYEVKYTERGTTPYRRPPYSFVADGFVVMGDAACLTKPHAGEGVTSSMVQAEIAADEVAKALCTPDYLSRERLWGVNTRYIETQGKTYAGMLATLIGAVSTSAVENDFFFRKDVVFSKKSFESMGDDKPLAFTTGEMLRMAFVMAGGVLTGKLKIKTIQSLLNGMSAGNEITKLYSEYPTTPAELDAWTKRADDLWSKCGTMTTGTAS